MTVKEFNSLADGTAVWFRPPYFAFAMPATVRIMDGSRGLWVNFYGDGQCFSRRRTAARHGSQTGFHSAKSPQNTYENDKTVINRGIP